MKSHGQLNLKFLLFFLVALHCFGYSESIKTTDERGVTVKTQEQSIIATTFKGSKVLWEKQFLSGNRISTLVVSDSVTVVNNNNASRSSEVTNYNLLNGELKWKRDIDSIVSQPYIRKNNLFFVYYTSGNTQYAITLILERDQGNQVAKILGSWVIENTASLLFKITNDVQPYEGSHLKYVRFDLASDITKELNFTIPPRRGCGEVQLDTRQMGRTEKIDKIYVYATRYDSCGTFVTKFNWNASES